MFLSETQIPKFVIIDLTSISAPFLIFSFSSLCFATEKKMNELKSVIEKILEGKEIGVEKRGLIFMLFLGYNGIEVALTF